MMSAHTAQIRPSLSARSSLPRRFDLPGKLTVFVDPPGFTLPDRPLALGLISMRPHPDWPAHIAVAWVTDRGEVGGGEMLVRPACSPLDDSTQACHDVTADPRHGRPTIHPLDAALTLEQLFAGMTLVGDAGPGGIYADVLASASVIERSWCVKPALGSATDDAPGLALADRRPCPAADTAPPPPSLADLLGIAHRCAGVAQTACHPRERLGGTAGPLAA